MKKILFLIHDLGQGGAEKVLVNLVNNMDKTRYDITVMALFAGGVNEKFLAKNIKYKTVFKKTFRGNSHFMKLFSPELLHKMFIKENYDIEIAYLEGPASRIISGCRKPETKLISWIHCEQHSEGETSVGFRNYEEAERCYNRFNKIVCVSNEVKRTFCENMKVSSSIAVLYNTNESKKILQLSKNNISNIEFKKEDFKIVCVGKLLKNKGFDRILRISKKLLDEKYSIHTYILGIGPEENNLKDYIKEKKISDRVTLLGYQTNPYYYIVHSDLFVCTSYREGFSTAATEALILGVPVCTVNVSGMKEMLGDNDEYGIVVDNDEEKLFEAIKSLIDNPDKLEFYRRQAEIRGKSFSTEETVKAVEEMLMKI